MTSIREITSPAQKAEICEKILRALPNWFGVEQSIVEYIRDVQAKGKRPAAAHRHRRGELCSPAVRVRLSGVGI